MCASYGAVASPLVSARTTLAPGYLASTKGRSTGSAGQVPAAGAQRGDDAAVHEQVAAGDEAVFGAEQEGRGGRALVGRADAPAGGGLDHLLIVGGAGAGHLIAGQ